MSEHYDPNRLSFSTNWNNKLDCAVFSTIRLYNANNHFVGKFVEIWDNSTKPGKFRGRGKFVQVGKFKLNQLKPSAAYLDTGYDLPTTLNILRTMYKNITDLEKKDFAYIIVEKVKENNKQSQIFEK